MSAMFPLILPGLSPNELDLLKRENGGLLDELLQEDLSSDPCLDMLDLDEDIDLLHNENSPVSEKPSFVQAPQQQQPSPASLTQSNSLPLSHPNWVKLPIISQALRPAAVPISVHSIDANSSITISSTKPVVS